MKEFIPYGRQNISEEDIESVLEVLQSSYLTQGPTVPLFENLIASKVKSDFAIAVNSATSALHLACMAIGLNVGDILWTSPNTFVASANCGLYCGAKVDFVDIDPNTGLISIDLLRLKLIEAEKKNTLPKVIIPVHLGGSSCQMEEIQKLTKNYGIHLIEDASHAIGGKYQGLPVGNCRYSDMTIFSMHPVKIITSGEGGVVTTNNEKYAQKIRDLRTHGIVKDEERFHETSYDPWTYELQALGYNYRLTDIHAALGISQLSKLENFVFERNNLRNTYSNLLQNLPLKLLKIPANVYSSNHLLIIRLFKQDSDFHRMVFESLRASNIGVQIHYIPVHLHPLYKKFGFKLGDFPEAENYAKNAISLPIFPGLTNDQISYIVDILKKIIS